jgi:hypothetical protein
MKTTIINCDICKKNKGSHLDTINYESTKESLKSFIYANDSDLINKDICNTCYKEIFVKIADIFKEVKLKTKENNK